tara:strand:- start:47 stop:397 length:351 start_codon:yes stop_codon:yes gene_type:complete
MAYGSTAPPPKKKPVKRKPAPPGYHYMPNGKLMKDSAMKKKAPVKKAPVKKKLDFDLKEGTFTRMAKEKGYGDNVQKLATDIMKHREKGVLPNGKKITALMIKKANFVVNARKFKK